MITLDAESFTPPFEQVRSQLAAQISAGTLVPGTRLPSVRQLAQDLGLAVNTVARAYRELEAAGLVETRGRGGTVVSAGNDGTKVRLVDAAREYAAVALSHGLAPEEALRYVRAALDPTPAQP